jgi:hypothetical protein
MRHAGGTYIPGFVEEKPGSAAWGSTGTDGAREDPAPLGGGALEPKGATMGVAGATVAAGGVVRILIRATPIGAPKSVPLLLIWMLPLFCWPNFLLPLR